MRQPPFRVFAVVFAASVILAPATALASGASDCDLTTAGSCGFVTTPASCSQQCTPPSFVADCDGQCNANPPAATCSAACNTSCSTTCNANPGTFSCAAACTSDCMASCTDVCSGKGSGCMADCGADCSNRCGVQCAAVPPTADCTAQCQTSCNASCDVQANIDCQTNCTASVVPNNCELACMSSSGAVFCGSPPQYIDMKTTTAACLAYLQSQGIMAPDAGASGAGGTSSGTKSGGCAMADVNRDASRAPFGALLALAVVGLLRRSRRETRRRVPE